MTWSELVEGRKGLHRTYQLENSARFLQHIIRQHTLPPSNPVRHCILGPRHTTLAQTSHFSTQQHNNTFLHSTSQQHNNNMVSSSAKVAVIACSFILIVLWSSCQPVQSELVYANGDLPQMIPPKEIPTTNGNCPDSDVDRIEITQLVVEILKNVSKMI